MPILLVRHPTPIRRLRYTRHRHRGTLAHCLVCGTTTCSLCSKVHAAIH